MHDKAGKSVGKGLGKARIVETLTHLKEVWRDDVIVSALMIAGLPHEPYEHIVETMDWMENTNLVTNYMYSALWVTPPSHKLFVLKQNAMSTDYEKYKLTWTEQGWQNNVGVTFNQVSELVANRMREYYTKTYPIDPNEYSDLRTVGFLHNELATNQFSENLINNVRFQEEKTKELINNRLALIMNITD